MIKKIKPTSSILIIIIIIGTILRFWQLDLKPFWSDEILTALFSLGKNYNNIPLNILFTPPELQQIFTLNPQANCNDISNNLIHQSTHPPLFFCLNNIWLKQINPFHHSNYDLIWNLRAFSAIVGVITIPVIYYLNSIAFSSQIGLISALMIATSPFAIYLSQEARHYTLPVLLISLSLLGLVKINQGLEKGEIKTKTWLFWVIINAISLYTHYFCFISFFAQIGTLLLIFYRLKPNFTISQYLIIFIYCILPILAFIPWLSIIINHFNSPKVSWISAPKNFEPLLQIIMSWILMIITLPVENQGIVFQIISGTIMIGFTGWILWQWWKRFFEYNPKNRNILVFSGFILFSILQFLAIAYILKKDITVNPRYNFIYYPAFVSLLSVILPKKTKIIIAIVGVISSAFVVNNLAFQKAYQPDIVAHKFNHSSAPLMVVLGYESTDEIILGLSYVVELDRIRDRNDKTVFYFANRNQDYLNAWDKLSKLSLSVNPENLWIFTPFLRSYDAPNVLQLGQKNKCLLNIHQQYKVRFPYFYNLYQCSPR